MQVKRFIKSYQRKLLAPFDARWKRAKLQAEKFVLKTMVKHGIACSENSVRSTDGGTAKISLSDGVGVLSMESSNLMLAFLKASQRQVADPRTSFQAIAIGNGMVLVGHPHVGTMYANASDVVQLPRLVMRNYQENTTIALERSVGVGDFVLHFGAQQGYHLLTLSHLVGPTGLLVAFETNDDIGTLRLNVESHRLESQVTIVGHEIRTCQSLTLLTPPGKNCIVFVSEGTQLDPLTAKSLTEFLKINSLATIVDGARVVSIEEFVGKISKASAFPFTSAA